MQASSTHRTRRLRTTVLAIVLFLAASGCGPLLTVQPHGSVTLPPPAQTSVIVDAAGATLASLHGDQDRQVVPLDGIPMALRSAVLAIEDSRFYSHGGIDAPAIVRALVHNAATGSVAQGGSTITQQLAKNTVVGAERSVRRKAAEASVALQLEAQLSKDAILERYLNTVSFGRGAYGVQAAARTYFGVDAATLSLPQSALLAALLRSPATHDPVEHPDVARHRRDLVLRVMAERGFASRTAVMAAQAAPLGVRWRPDPPWRAPAFVAHVLNLLEHDPAFAALGPDAAARGDLVLRGGLRIETTLDPSWQLGAEQAAAETLDQPADPETAVVALDPATGGIRALVSGRSSGVARGFNLATEARRQPGSVFKAIVLATALSQGHLLDETFPGGASVTVATGPGSRPWQVANADGLDFGPLTLRTATAHSVNVVYARLIADLGPEAVRRTARAMGVRSALRPFHSLALGAQEVTPLDMAGVMATLAAGGVHRPPTAVTRVIAPDGKVLYERPKPDGERVLEERVAAQTTNALQSVVEEGTGVRAGLQRPLAGKTGTSQQGADAWFAGYTPDLAAAVWIGFPQGRVPMVPPRTRIGVEGGTWPAELFARFGVRALATTPARDFPLPEAEPQGGTPVAAEVPDVVGLPVDAAARLLEGAGLTVTTQRVADALRPPGYVVAQEPLPAAGAQLTVSAPAVPAAVPQLVPVPDVLGADLARGRAQLVRAGLAPQIVLGCPGLLPGPPDTRGSTACTGADERPGQVWQMEPDAGATLPAGAAVRLFAYPRAPLGGVGD